MPAADYHALALRGDGEIITLGLTNFPEFAVPASATNVIAIAAGGQHSLALRRDGTVVGWGSNHYQQNAIPASATNVVAIADGRTSLPRLEE
ncbi:MAG TPA: RCC1 domain-containing protein [Candidatus Acidoferrum sp.]|nr:RCC1 domain-containing protein [Candidatus Acidoferrum sp.]